MRSLAVFAAALLFVVALTVTAPSAGAQSSAAAARKATAQAKAVTLHDMRSGGTIGTARLQQIGSTRTRITLQFAGTKYPQSTITLHRGTDCSNPQYASAASAIPLNPVSASQVSETIVNLPLTDLQSGNYLVDVRNATQSQQFVRACARLGR
jgi:hypothetical protein